MLANLHMHWQAYKVFNVNLKLKHTFIAIFGLALLISTLFVSGKVNNAEELKSVKFGAPLKFIGQDLSQSGIFWFPDYPKPKISREMNFNWFSLKNFLASFLVFFISLEIIIYTLEWADFKIRQLIFKNKN